jgi:uncharacterized lipoprotein YmbA
MKRSFVRSLLLAALAALTALTACGSSKDPTLYSLASRPGKQQAGTPKLVELRRPGLAGYLDRASIVTKVADYQLKVAGGDQWAEPLGDMIGRILAQDLTTRMPDTNVFVENGAISAVPEAIVAVDIRRFDASEDGKLTLSVQIVIESGSAARRTVARALTFTAVPKSSDTGELIAAMSNLVGELADSLAAMLHDG